MSVIKNLLRENAMILDAVETGLVMLIAFGLHMSSDQQNYIVAAVVAAFGILKAITVRPWSVAPFVDFGRAALVLAAGFGLHGLSPDRIAVMVTFLGTLMTLIMRNQVTPVQDPVAGGGVPEHVVTGATTYSRNAGPIHD